MDIPIDNDPVILDQDDPTAPPIPLVYPEESEDEFGRKIKPRQPRPPKSQLIVRPHLEQESKSWHTFAIHRQQQSPTQSHLHQWPPYRGNSANGDYPQPSRENTCCCRMEDFHPLKTQDSNITTRSELNPRSFLRSRLSVRSTLESMLTNAIALDMEANEASRSLYETHNILNETLEYTMQYLDCAGLETRSLARLCAHIDRRGLGQQEEVTNEGCTFNMLIKQLSLPSKFGYYWMKKDIAASLSSNQNVEKLVIDFKDKKDDFSKATHNLRVILDTNFTTVQLLKLKKQFDVIQIRFQHSRERLEKHLPEFIAERKQLLVNIFGVLGEDAQHFANDRSDFALICQHLENGLKDEIFLLSTDSAGSISETMEPHREDEEHHHNLRVSSDD